MNDGKTSLAKLATIFAVVFGIAFGLCSVVVFSGIGIESTLAKLFIPTAVVTEGVCLLGLLTVGVLAIVRSLRSKE